jgi:lysine 2,3-aminomutase
VTTRRILQGLQELDTVRTVRVGTRLPLQSPKSLGSGPIAALLDALRDLRAYKGVYILLHVNHPDELTRDVLEGFSCLAEVGAPLLSQTVFLRDINDDFDVLARLFKELYYACVVPYYLYSCDRVRGLEHFVCSPERERDIVTRLTSELSGIAVPTYVLDVAGKGKIPVPLGFWSGTDLTHCRDYDGTPVAAFR